MEYGTRALLVMASRDTARVWAALEAHGFEIDHALNCREARTLLQAGVEFDLVVSDLSLPDGNWWTVSCELTRTGHPAKLVVCASSASDAQPFTRGLAEVIRPPIDPATIECVLERLGLVGCGFIGAASGF